MLLIYSTIWGQWVIISWTTRSAVGNSNFPSSKANKARKITPELYYQGKKKKLLSLRFLLTNCVDCTQRSFNSPFSRNRRVRSIEHMSIFPITLKLGLWRSRSNCNGVEVSGYWTPAFQPKFLYKIFTKTGLDPLQQITVASPEIAVNNHDSRSM